MVCHSFGVMFYEVFEANKFETTGRESQVWRRVGTVGKELSSGLICCTYLSVWWILFTYLVIHRRPEAYELCCCCVGVVLCAQQRTENRSVLRRPELPRLANYLCTVLNTVRVLAVACCQCWLRVRCCALEGQYGHKVLRAVCNDKSLHS